MFAEISETMENTDIGWAIVKGQGLLLFETMEMHLKVAVLGNCDKFQY